MRMFPYSPTLALALAIGLALIFRADAQTRYNAVPHSNSVRIDGTSTAHDWEMEGGMIGGFLELGAGVTLDKTQSAPGGIQGDKIPVKAHVIIPVATIHSKADHLPGVMDDLMQKAMKAGDFPRIEFTASELTFKGPHTASKPFEFEVAGDLAIAGATKKVSFPITIEPQEGGQIKVSGSAPLKMTDYGVPPPAPILAGGALRCGDDVKILFDWTLKEKK